MRSRSPPPRLPFADRDGAALVAGALDLPERLETLNVTSSLRAGTSALANAARRADRRRWSLHPMRGPREPGSPQEALVWARRRGDVGAVRGIGRIIAWPAILAIEQVAADFVDHYRGSGESFDYGLEERWVRDEGYGKLVARRHRGSFASAQACMAADVAHLAMPGPPDVLKRVLQAAQLTGCQDRAKRFGQSAEIPELRSRCCCWRMRSSARSPARHSAGGIWAGRGCAGAACRCGTCPAETQTAGKRRWRAASRNRATCAISRTPGLLDVDFGMRAERDNRTAQTVAWRKHRALSAFVGGALRALRDRAVSRITRVRQSRMPRHATRNRTIRFRARRAA